MQYITEQEIDQISSETGKRLAAEKKDVLTIRSRHGEAYWEGGVNGHFFRIRTETPVAVPQSLAALIARSSEVLVLSSRALRAYEQSGGRKLG